jgi:hypothetical protein
VQEQGKVSAAAVDLIGDEVGLNVEARTTVLSGTDDEVRSQEKSSEFRYDVTGAWREGAERDAHGVDGHCYVRRAGSARRIRGSSAPFILLATCIHFEPPLD